MSITPQDGPFTKMLNDNQPKKKRPRRRTRGRNPDDDKFRGFFEERGFRVNRTYGRAINPGSPHPKGLGADIDINGKSDDEIGDLVEQAIKNGYRLFDERIKQPGVKQTGAHLHFERPPSGSKPSKFIPGRYGKRDVSYLQELDAGRRGSKPSGTGGEFTKLLQANPEVEEGEFTKLLKQFESGPNIQEPVQTTQPDVLNPERKPWEPIITNAPRASDAPPVTQNGQNGTSGVAEVVPTDPEAGTAAVGQTAANDPNSVVYRKKVTFQDKPNDVSNTEWAIQQLVPEIAAQTGHEAIDVEKQLRKGMVHYAGVPIDEISRDKWYEFVGSEDFVEAITLQRDARERALEEALQSPEEWTPADWARFSKETGTDPAVIQEALTATEGPVAMRYGESAQIGARRKQQLAELTAQIQQQTGLPQFSAGVKARQQMGFIDPAKANDMLLKEDEAQVRFEQEFKDGFIDWSHTLSAAGPGDMPVEGEEMQRRVAEYTSGPEAEQRLNEYIQLQMENTLQRYGSYTHGIKERERYTREYDPNGRAMARPLEFAKSFARALPDAVASLFRGAAAIQDLNLSEKLYSYVTGQEQTRIQDRSMVKAAEWIEAQTEGAIGENPDLQVDLIDKITTSIIPNALGQLTVQLGAGAFTGSAAVATALGSAQGLGEQQKDAIKGGASDNQLRLIQLAAAVAAVPDIIPYSKWLGKLAPTERFGMLGKMYNRMFTSLSAQVPEKQAVELTKGFIARTLNKAKTLAVSTGFESGQELTEKKINDAIAAATYDPDRKVLTITDEDLLEAFGGAVGGAAGGSFEISLDETRQDQTANDTVNQVLANFHGGTPPTPTTRPSENEAIAQQQKAQPAPQAEPGTPAPVEQPLAVGSTVTTPQGEGRIVKESPNGKNWVVEYNPKVNKQGETVYQSVKDFRKGQVSAPVAAEPPAAPVAPVETKRAPKLQTELKVAPRTEETSRIHEYSSTQVDLPKKEAQQVLDLGQKLVDEKDIYNHPTDPSFGREEKPHITVKWGLETENADEVKVLLADEKPFIAKLGKVSIFPGGKDKDYDVVKVEVTSPDLKRLNKKISESTKTAPSEFDYKPHVTIAYVKKGKGQKYVNNKELLGQQVTFNSLTFSGKNGKITTIPLAGKGTAKPTTALKSVFKTPVDREEYFAKRAYLKRKLDETGFEATAADLEAGHMAVSKYDVTNYRATVDKFVKSLYRPANLVTDHNFKELRAKLVRRRVKPEEQVQVQQIKDKLDEYLASKNKDLVGVVNVEDIVNDVFFSQVLGKARVGGQNIQDSNGTEIDLGDTIIRYGYGAERAEVIEFVMHDNGTSQMVRVRITHDTNGREIPVNQQTESTVWPDDVIIKEKGTIDMTDPATITRVLDQYFQRFPSLVESRPVKEQPFTDVLKQNIIGPARQLAAPLVYRPPYTMSALLDPRFEPYRVGTKQISKETITSTAFKSAKPMEKTVITNVLESPRFKDRKKFPFAEFEMAVSRELLPLNVIFETEYSDYGSERTGGNFDAQETHIYNVQGLQELENMDHGYLAHWGTAFRNSIEHAHYEVKDMLDAAGEPVYLVVPLLSGDKLSGSMSLNAEYPLWVRRRTEPGTANASDPVKLTERNIHEVAIFSTNKRGDAEHVAEQWTKAVHRNQGLFGHARVWYKDNIAYMVEAQGEGLQKIGSYSGDRGPNVSRQFNMNRQEWHWTNPVSSAVTLVYNHFLKMRGETSDLLPVNLEKLFEEIEETKEALTNPGDAALAIRIGGGQVDSVAGEVLNEARNATTSADYKDQSKAIQRELKLRADRLLAGALRRAGIERSVKNMETQLQKVQDQREQRRAKAESPETKELIKKVWELTQEELKQRKEKWNKAADEVYQLLEDYPEYRQFDNYNDADNYAHRVSRDTNVPHHSVAWMDPENREKMSYLVTPDTVQLQSNYIDLQANWSMANLDSPVRQMMRDAGLDSGQDWWYTMQDALQANIYGNTTMAATINGNRQPPSLEDATKNSIETLLNYGQNVNYKQVQQDLLDLQKSVSSHDFQKYEENEKKLIELWTKLPEAFPQWAKQFVSYQKTFAQRLTREEIKRAAQRGHTKFRIPAPETGALVEGHTTKSNITDASAPDLTTLGYEGYSTSYTDSSKRQFDVGAMIKVGDDIYEVVETEKETFKAVPTAAMLKGSATQIIMSLSGEDLPTGADARVQRARELLAEQNYRVISDKAQGTTSKFIALAPDQQYQMVEFPQPGTKAGAPDFAKIRAGMYQQYHAIFDRYIKNAEDFFKERKDARYVTDDQGNRWIETDITEADKALPVAVFRADKYEQHEADRAKWGELEEFNDEFFSSVHSTVDDSGAVKLNFAAAELIRRMETQSMLDAGQEAFVPLFNAGFARKDEVQKYLDSLDGVLKQMEATGYPEDSQIGVKTLRDQIAAFPNGAGVVYVRDYALPHEKIHEARYINAALQASIQNYYKDFKKTFKVAKTDDGSRPINQKTYVNYFKEVYFNGKPMSKLSMEELAVVHEETFVAIVDGDYKKLGLTDSEAARFIEEDLKAYVEMHGEEILDDLEVWVNEKVAKFGTIEKLRSGLQAETEFKKAGHSVPSTGSGRPGGVGESDNVTPENEIVQERIKDRAVPKTIAERTTLNEEDLTPAARQLEQLSRDTTAKDADSWVKQQGFESAYIQVLGDMPVNATSTARRMAVIEHIDAQVERYYINGDIGRAKEWYGKLVALTNVISPEYTEYGRAIGQLARWSDFDTNTIVGHVQQKIAKSGQKSELTLAQQQQLRDQAKQISDLEKRVKDLESKERGAKGSKENVLKKQKEAANTALDKLKNTFTQLQAANRSLKLAADKIRKLGAAGTAASWINRNENNVNNWTELYNSENGLEKLKDQVDKKFKEASDKKKITEASTTDLTGYLNQQIELAENGVELANPQVQQAVHAARFDRPSAAKALQDFVAGERALALQEWKTYLTVENDVYAADPFFREFVWNDLMNIRSDRPDIPPSLDRAVLAGVYETVQRGDNFSAFNKLYQKESSKNLRQANDLSKVKVTGGEWIKIPRTAEGHPDFNRNTQRLRSLSASSWCTSRGMEKPYIQKGDFWIYQENGTTQLAIRFDGAKVAEIQGRNNNGRIPLEYLDQVTELQNSGEAKFGAKANNQISAAKQQVAEKQKIEDWIKKENIDFTKIPASGPNLEKEIRTAPSLVGAQMLYKVRTGKLDAWIKEHEQYLSSRDKADLTRATNLTPYYQMNIWSGVAAKVGVAVRFDKMTTMEQEQALGLTKLKNGKYSFPHRVRIGKGGIISNPHLYRPENNGGVNVPTYGMNLTKFLDKIEVFEKSVALAGDVKMPNLRFAEKNLAIETKKVETPKLQVVGGNLLISPAAAGNKFPNLIAVGGTLSEVGRKFGQNPRKMVFPSLIRINSMGLKKPGVIFDVRSEERAFGYQRRPGLPTHYTHTYHVKTDLEGNEINSAAGTDFLETRLNMKEFSANVRKKRGRLLMNVDESIEGGDDFLDYADDIAKNDKTFAELKKRGEENFLSIRFDDEPMTEEDERYESGVSAGYAAQEERIKELFGDEAAKNANYGQAMTDDEEGNPIITTKVYGHGWIVTRVDLNAMDVEHDESELEFDDDDEDVDDDVQAVIRDLKNDLLDELSEYSTKDEKLDKLSQFMKEYRKRLENVLEDKEDLTKIQKDEIATEFEKDIHWTIIGASQTTGESESEEDEFLDYESTFDKPITGLVHEDGEITVHYKDGTKKIISEEEWNDYTNSGQAQEIKIKGYNDAPDDQRAGLKLIRQFIEQRFIKDVEEHAKGITKEAAENFPDIYGYAERMVEEYVIEYEEALASSRDTLTDVDIEEEVDDFEKQLLQIAKKYTDRKPGDYVKMTDDVESDYASFMEEDEDNDWPDLLLQAADDNPISNFPEETRKALVDIGMFKLLEGRLGDGQSFEDWKSAVRNTLTEAGLDPSPVEGYYKSLYRETINQMKRDRYQAELDRMKEKYNLTDDGQARQALITEKEARAKKIKLAADANRVVKPERDKRTALQIAIDNEIEASGSTVTRDEALSVKDRNAFFSKLAGKKPPAAIADRYLEAVNIYINATESLREAREERRAAAAVKAPGLTPALSKEEQKKVNQELDQARKERTKQSHNLRKLIDQIVTKPKTARQRAADWYLRTNKSGEALLTATVKTAAHNVLAQRATKLINVLETAVELGFAKVEDKLGLDIFSETGVDIPSTTRFRDIAKEELKSSSFPAVQQAVKEYWNGESNLLASLQTIAAHKQRVVEGVLGHNPDLYDNMIGGFTYGDAALPPPEIDDSFSKAGKGVEKAVRGLEKYVHYATALNRVQEKHFRFATFLATLAADLKGRGVDLDQVIQEGQTAKIPRADLERAVQRALEDTFGLDMPSDGSLDRLIKSASDTASWIPFFLNPMLFRRFFYNSNKFMIEHSPLVLSKLVTEKGFSRRDAAKFTMGMGMFIFALQLLKHFGSDDDDPTVLKVPTPWGPQNIRMAAYNPISTFLAAANLYNRVSKGKTALKTGQEPFLLFGIDTRYPNLALDWWKSIINLGGGDDAKWLKLEEQSKILGARGLAAFLRPLATVKDIIGHFDEMETAVRDPMGQTVRTELGKTVPFLSTKNVPGLEAPPLPREDVMTGKPLTKHSPLLDQLGFTFINDNQIGAKFSPAEEYLDQAAADERAKRPKRFKSPEERRSSAITAQLYTAIDKGNNVSEVAKSYKDRKLITKDQYDQVMDANRIKSTLQRKAEEVGINKIVEAYWLADEGGKEILRKVLKKKVRSQKASNSLTADEKRTAEEILKN